MEVSDKLDAEEEGAPDVLVNVFAVDTVVPAIFSLTFNDQFQ
jgi:hypothetical protein